VASSSFDHTPIVILAGGLGTRLRSVLPDGPKGLAPVGEQSFLEIQLRLFREQGARRFVLCVGYQSARIEAALGNGQTWGVRIDYSADGERLLGTAGALKLAERFFAPRALVVNGDTYFALDYHRLLQRHVEMRARHGVVATLSLATADAEARYGNVVLDASGQFVSGFREKDSSAAQAGCWLNAGAYVIERELLDVVPANEPCALEHHVFPRALAANLGIAAYTTASRFYDIGTPDSWRAFTDYYLEMCNGKHAKADSAAYQGQC